MCVRRRESPGAVRDLAIRAEVHPDPEIRKTADHFQQKTTELRALNRSVGSRRSSSSPRLRRCALTVVRGSRLKVFRQWRDLEERTATEADVRQVSAVSECGFAVRSLASQECAFSPQRVSPAERAVGRSARRAETKPISHQGSRSAASLSPMEKCLPGVIASAQGVRMRIAFAVLAY
jgi:hypothetical protein